MSATHTHVITEFADPYLKCNICRRPARGFVSMEGQVPECQHTGHLTPCGHMAMVTSDCPSWSPVDGCRCMEHLGHIPHKLIKGDDNG